MDLQPYYNAIESCDLVKVIGKVIQVVGLVVEAQVQGVFIGELCNVEISEGHMVQAEVVGFKEQQVLLMPLGNMRGIRPGSRIYGTGHPIQVKVGMGLLGRVLDGLGNPIDQKGELDFETYYQIDRDPPDPIMRPRIDKVLKTGVNAIDAAQMSI